jgi:Zn-dependent protease
MLGTSPQNKGWHLFDVSGHRVYMQPWFLLLIALFAFAPVSARADSAFALVNNVLVWGPVLFGGILIHEFGHAAALKHFGNGGSTIVLQGFGGVTINQRRGHNPPNEAIIISLAGPAASLALAFVSGAMLMGLRSIGVLGSGLIGQFGSEFLWFMFGANLVWAVFNLIPINPLDGGHVVLHALRAKFGNRRKAMHYTAIASLVVLGITIVACLALGIGGFLMVAIGIMLGMQNYQLLQQTGGGPPRGTGRRV